MWATGVTARPAWSTFAVLIVATADLCCLLDTPLLPGICSTSVATSKDYPAHVTPVHVVDRAEALHTRSHWPLCPKTLVFQTFGTNPLCYCCCLAKLTLDLLNADAASAVQTLSHLTRLQHSSSSSGASAKSCSVGSTYQDITEAALSDSSPEQRSRDGFFHRSRTTAAGCQAW